MADADNIRVAQALATLASLMMAGEHLLGEAQRNAPVREGTLRGSFELAFIVNGQRLEGPGAYAQAQAMVAGLAKIGALRDIDVEVSANTIYAARQHEELDWNHPLGGGAKFLERPFTENQARYHAATARAVANVG